MVWGFHNDFHLQYRISSCSLRVMEDSTICSQVTYPALSPDSLSHALRAPVDSHKQPGSFKSSHRALVVISSLSV